MAEVYPFRAVHYRDLDHLADLAAPPYDVISRAEQISLYNASPHNIVRLELGQRDSSSDDAGFYERAGDTLKTWLEERVLVREPQPGFYAYRQTYSLPGRPSRSRTALFGEVKIEEFASGVIRPHEETFAGPKADRLQLIRACRANLSPIFGLYQDVPAVTEVLEQTTSGEPIASFTDKLQIRQELWRISDPAACQVITEGLADSSILIADGHHRYETALAYRAERREQAGATDQTADAWYERILFALVSTADPGLVILPTHRILRRVANSVLKTWKSRFEGASLTALVPRKENIAKALAEGSSDECRFVIIFSVQCYLLTLPACQGSALEQLDVSRLHREILSALAGSSDPHELDIEYTQDTGLALDAVHSGRAPVAVLVNPTPISAVNSVAASGARMPEKSTYFYPKLSTGLVLRVE